MSPSLDQTIEDLTNILTMLKVEAGELPNAQEPAAGDQPVSQSSFVQASTKSESTVDTFAGKNLRKQAGREETKELEANIKRQDHDMASSSSNVVGVHYRVGKKIGEGSFGVIFEGTNLLNNQQVAIKFVRGIFLLRLSLY